MLSRLNEQEIKFSKRQFKRLSNNKINHIKVALKVYQQR